MTIIKSSAILYLNEAILEKYRNVKVVSAERMSIRMNLLILCAMSHSLKMAFDEDDVDHTIITEFSLEELKQVKEFCISGSCNAISTSVLEAFGFLKKGHVQLSRENLNENSVFKTSWPNDSLIKPELLPKNEIIDEDEIKEEHMNDLDDNDFEYDHFLEDFGSDDFLTSVIQKEEEEEDENLKIISSKKSNEIDDNSDDWKPGKKLKNKSKKKSSNNNARIRKDRGKPKGKVGRPFVHELSEKDLELYKTFELPKPLDTYIKKPMNLKGLISKIEENKNDQTKHFQCTVCQYRVPTMANLKRHEIRHHNEHLSCQICSNAFYVQDAEIFKKHMFYHLNYENSTNAFHAKIRKRLLEKQKKSLIPKIKKKQKKVKPVSGICYVCGLDSKDVKAHIREAHPNGERVNCPDCGMDFPGKMRLGRHFRRVHRKVQCQKCGDIVTNMNNHMKKHVSIYDRPHKCETCSKGFWYKGQLEEHLNVHTGEKPFKCKYCPSAFGSQGSRDMHQKGHLGIKRKSSK